MATLEVHDGQGRVEFVSVSSNTTILFGSDPHCDVPIDDPAASRIHARMSWRRGRFKLEASPEVRSIRVNGKALVAAAFRPGDELQIGHYRIYLMQEPAERPADDSTQDEEKTRVVDRPPVATAAPVRPTPLPQAEEFELPSSDESPASPSKAQRPPLRGTTTKSRRRGSDRASATVAARPPGRVRRFWQRMTGADRAPGDERIMGSPLVVALIGTLVVLSGLSYGLWTVISRQTATNQFRRGVSSLEEGDPVDAIRQFDMFLSANSRDSRASKARVLRGLARIRQFTAGSPAPWSEALGTAGRVVEEVSTEPAFDDSRMDFGLELLRVAEGLATRTKGSGDAEDLRETQDALALHNQITGQAAAAQRERTRLPTLLVEAESAVRRMTRRRETLAAMDAGLAAGSVETIFDARDSLVATYPDLATDADVVARLETASQLIRRAVTFDPSRRSAETVPRQEPLGPLTSIVLRQKPGEEISSANETTPVVVAISGGLALGLDARDGAPLWQRSVGLSVPYPPLVVPGPEPTALLIDARHDELLRIDPMTGTLVWRQELGEAAVDPPLVVGTQVLQPLPSGRLVRIDLETGELRGSLVLGRPVSRTPMTDESGRFLYQPADEAVLFVIDRESFECLSVVYLGHESGSLPCGPVRMGWFLIQAENHQPFDGRLRVLRMEPGKPDLSPVQLIDVEGWIWTPPKGLGSTLWTATDRNLVVAFAIGDESQRQPFKKVAQLTPDARPSGPAFTLMPSEMELWVSNFSRVSRLELAPERARVTTSWTVVDLGQAAEPLQRAGNRCVVSQLAPGPSGKLLSAIDSRTGSIIWRTQFGTAWPVPATAGGAGSAHLLGITGKPIELSSGDLQDGGFVEQPFPSSNELALPAPPWVWLPAPVGEAAVWISSPDSEQMLVRGSDLSLTPVSLPVRLSAWPAWLTDGSTLIVPGINGLVYALDAASGRPVAATFATSYNRTRPAHWLQPCVLSPESFLLTSSDGRLQIVDVQTEEDRKRLVARGSEITIGQPVMTDPAVAGASVLLVTADRQIRGFSTRDLSPSGAWPLEFPVEGPLRSLPGGWVVATDAGGTVHAFGPDGQRRWTRRLSGPVVPGPPGLSEGQELGFVTRSGVFELLGLDDGEPLMTIALGMPAAGPPIATGATWSIPTAPGTLQMIAPSPMENAP